MHPIDIPSLNCLLFACPQCEYAQLFLNIPRWRNQCCSAAVETQIHSIHSIKPVSQQLFRKYPSALNMQLLPILSFLGGATLALSAAVPEVRPPINTPAPMQPGAYAHCEQFYLASPGVTCQDIAAAHRLNFDVFIALNPQVPAAGGCDGGAIIPHHWYCVKGDPRELLFLPNDDPPPRQQDTVAATPSRGDGNSGNSPNTTERPSPTTARATTTTTTTTSYPTITCSVDDCWRAFKLAVGGAKSSQSSAMQSLAVYASPALVHELPANMGDLVDSGERSSSIRNKGGGQCGRDTEKIGAFSLPCASQLDSTAFSGTKGDLAAREGRRKDIGWNPEWLVISVLTLCSHPSCQFWNPVRGGPGEVSSRGLARLFGSHSVILIGRLRIWAFGSCAAVHTFALNMKNVMLCTWTTTALLMTPSDVEEADMTALPPFIDLRAHWRMAAGYPGLEALGPLKHPRGTDRPTQVTTPCRVEKLSLVITISSLSTIRGGRDGLMMIHVLSSHDCANVLLDRLDGNKLTFFLGSMSCRFLIMRSKAILLGLDQYDQAVLGTMQAKPPCFLFGMDIEVILLVVLVQISNSQLRSFPKREIPTYFVTSSGWKSHSPRTYSGHTSVLADIIGRPLETGKTPLALHIFGRNRFNSLFLLPHPSRICLEFAAGLRLCRRGSFHLNLPLRRGTIDALLHLRKAENMLCFKIWASFGILGIVFWDGSHGQAEALSWGRNKKYSTGMEFEENAIDRTLPRYRESRLPNIYAVAMGELQELESEPLCHRIAARLLVNNCQLLDGKDDATVLTDSGRQVRDFVDSYAASLAICDLERGSFAIPSACSKFREDVLARVSVPDAPRLHVSSQEIDSCLSGLAQSDSAWNTWVSYRHKSLRFCIPPDTPYRDRPHIYLYQRLARVLEQLTEGVEAELEKHWQSIDTRAREALESLDNLTPQIDQRALNTDLLHSVKARVLDLVIDGVESAKSLQQLMTDLLRTVLESNTAVAVAQEGALEEVSQRANAGISMVMATLTAAAATSAALYDQLVGGPRRELSRLRAAELEDRQAHVEQVCMPCWISFRMKHLTNTYHNHSGLLDRAQERTDGILQTLREASESASAVQSSFVKSGQASWWPFVVCPTISLMMGSYGLPPSIYRNLGLIALGLTRCLRLRLIVADNLPFAGEFAGLAVSYTEYLTSRHD
ncbi:hypothetical protein ACRALDRAFT_2106194 [Sodiomyces alcalophilus JCM 7366]|uniref:uncharacterized protein n=1 Tax=Sodiomyces alcalophilus JCM 7366 TaxID=591952 RepID=UPI0039B671A2